MGTPNSVYKYVGSDGTPVSNYFYNSNGKVIFQLDLQKHDSWDFGHGHIMTTPGNLGSGHIPTNHIPPILVPYKYLSY
ncbi:hypothetical protein ACQKCJ_16880 [Flavobacterium sp. NPDC079362]|uniref:hypothetical protein n=1 Tax=Flavobacterium sp. NPDC079362 TaxID=3390566 RepID=UPI003D014D33